MRKRGILTVFLVILLAVSITACGGGGGGGGSGGGGAPPIIYSLTVAKSGAGSGTITSVPAGINCGTDCTEDYTSGTAVSLTAMPYLGFRLNGWLGDCSGTGGGCVVTMDDVKSVTATFASATPSVKEDGFAPIPDSEYTEKIIFAVNEDFAVSHNGWEVKAQGIIDHINVVLDRSAGNKKRYAVKEFITYKISELGVIDTNPKFYFDNGFTSRFVVNDKPASPAGGTTIFIFMAETADQEIPEKFNRFGGAPYMSTIFLSGRAYFQVWKRYLTTSSLLTEVAESIKNGWPNNWRDVMVGALLHELGHSLGLAIPDEWYSYNFDDFSEGSPDLRHWQYEMYPGDPMTAWLDSGTPMKFADFNAWVIGKNANHQYYDISEAIPKDIKVKVVDAQGFPVFGATVKVYGAVKKGGTITDMGVLLETLIANVDGEVVITNDFPDVWVAKGVKASLNGKYAGSVLTLTDLEISWLLKKMDTHTLTLTLTQ